MTHQADRFYTIVVIPGEKVYVLFSGGPWHEHTKHDIFNRHIYAVVHFWNPHGAAWIVQEGDSYSWPIPNKKTEIKGDM